MRDIAHAAGRRGRCCVVARQPVMTAIGSGPTGFRSARIVSIKSCRATAAAFSGKVFLLCVLQHLRQLGISAVVGQDQDHL